MIASYGKTLDAMLEILGDGKPHHRDELHKCCGPSSSSVVKVHICKLRKLLRPQGRDIVCVWYGSKLHWQQVRLINDDE